MSLRELHRFANGPVTVHGHLHWDILRLWGEIREGRLAAVRDVGPLSAIGVDAFFGHEAQGRGRGFVNPSLLKGAEQGYEEAAALLAAQAIAAVPVIPPPMWALAGRQDIMTMRRLIQMKAF